jgi:predicted metal-binding membrane protein
MFETQSPSGGLLRWQPPTLRLRATAPFELLIAGCWIGLVWWSITQSASSGGGHQASMDMGSMSGMSSMPGMAMSSHASVTRAAVAGLPIWAVMTIAMMLPGTLPALSHVASHSYRWRRRRAMTEFAIVYLAVWVAFGVVALAVVSLVHTSTRLELGLALVLACGWQLTVFKRQAVRDCHRSVPMPPNGRAATRGVARFGLVNGGACLRACWPAMLAMAAVPMSQMLLWMPVLTGLMTTEKLAQRPHRTRRMVAVGFVLSAVVAAVVT